jgi:hypothetical protein
VIREVPPVIGGEEHDVGVVARRQAPLAVGTVEHMCGIHRAGSKRLLRRE